MNTEKRDIQTGFRISEEMSRSIESIARECGTSKNATMRMLMARGIRAWEPNLQQESAHIPSHSAQSLE